MSPDRREFLRDAAITVVAAAGTDTAASVQRAPAQGAPAQGDRTQGARAPAGAAPPTAQPAPRVLDAALLAAVGEAVLPESLGATGRAAAVAAFSRWVEGYRPVSEEMHGYGDAEITFTPPDPAPGWHAQLTALDLLARRKHRRAFGRLGVPLRREVLATAIGRGGAARLPSSPLDAGHVAVALMAHWASSSEAVDLAYEARIARENCRLLSETSRQPLPLAGGGAP